MFSKKFTALTSVFLIFAIVVGGMLGFYDARLEAAVTPKKQSMDKVKIKNKEDLTFDKDVVNILLVGSDNGAQGSEDGDHGRSDSMMVATINFKTKELKLTSFLRDMYVMHLVEKNFYIRHLPKTLILKLINSVLWIFLLLRKLSIALAVLK